jgi:hypothetical protein
MIIDGARAGDIIEINWSVRYERTIQMILINPIYSKIGTVNQRLNGWRGKTIYDNGKIQANKVPYTVAYELKWLKLCERQGNLKIISTNEANRE